MDEMYLSLYPKLTTLINVCNTYFFTRIGDIKKYLYWEICDKYGQLESNYTFQSWVLEYISHFLFSVSIQ